MGLSKKLSPKNLQAWGEERAKAIWTNLFTNNLWQRILKNTIATTIAITIALIPAVVRVYGPAAYLAPITTVFGHPGRRFGMMAEALVLAISGTLVGVAWSTLGVYLSSLLITTNPPAAYTVKSVFLAVALLFHGFVRSHAPRLFTFVLLLIIVAVVSLTGTAIVVTPKLVTTLLYPTLTASGVLLLVNTMIFPEFSSNFLGITTIETLEATVGALRDAGRYFVSVAEGAEKPGDESDMEEKPELERQAATSAEPKENANINPTFVRKILKTFNKSKKEEPKTDEDEGPEEVKLKTLTDSKAALRAKLASCKAAQTECNFELAWAVLPPRDLKPISDTAMKKLVANTIALIGACESKYALMGDESDEKDGEAMGEHHLKGIAKQAKVDTDFDRGAEPSRPGTPLATSHRDFAEGGEEVKGHKRRKSRWSTMGKSRSKSRSRSRSKSRTGFELEKEDLELVKPKKEIEFGDIELLKYLVSRISKPLADLQEKINRSVDVVTSSLAYCYDVKKLPSGVRPPAGIELEEIDIRVDILKEALEEFDRDSSFALESAAALHELDRPQVDIMPRMEIFLVSSFLLNLRQAALHTLEMLNHSRVIVERRQARHGRRRLYPPKIHWRKWLVSGGEDDMLALPEGARKENRSGVGREDIHDSDEDSTNSKESLVKKDVESAPMKESGSQSPRPSKKAKLPKRKIRVAEKGTFIHRVRNWLADWIEYLCGSEDVLYAIKLTVAVFLVTWPAFMHKWNLWYSLNRGLWAALQLVLISEVAIGTSVWTFVLRAVGTTIGCTWGYVAYEAGSGNRVVCVVILVIGVIPSAYIQLGSQYVKAGMVSIISMSIVALATEDHTVPGTATENYLKRMIAFLIGGVVALIVQVVLFPVKARDRLVESLAASIRQIGEMEACLAYGVETEANVDVHAAAIAQRFDRAIGKAQGALTAAETFLPFCAQEPRLKGSFKGLALVYAEILYVLHAVVDRMDNMLHLRHEYGSSILEELNAQVYPYRRNVVGSITLVLFAVHEALTNKLPLPQFLPSARLAHLRMVNRVREVILSNPQSSHFEHNLSETPTRRTGRSEIEINMVKRVVRQKFLSWNAASAGQIEVIEYLEELLELVKLLFGANEFRSGMLTRDRIDKSFHESGKKTKGEETRDRVDGNTDESAVADDERDEARDVVPESEARKIGLTRRRTTFSRNQDATGRRRKEAAEEEELEKRKQAAQEELPRSLRRVRSRRLEEMTLQRSRSVDEEARRREGKRASRS